jgi:hypothetical protein
MQWMAPAVGIAMRQNAVDVAEPFESAYGYKQKSEPTPRQVRFAPDSRHSNADVCFPADYVCLTPNSRRRKSTPWRSAYDPEQNSSNHFYMR